MFSHFYGIQPWEVTDLTFDEIDEYRKQHEAYVKAQKKQSTVTKRRR